MRLWLTEKHDQAKHLAPLLGNPQRGRGYYETNDGIVTWAFGHMMRQADPQEYDPRFEKWTLEPIIPTTWKMLPDADRADQVEVIGKLLAKASEVVIATDPDAEGEAIGRELLDHFGYRGAVLRLWYNATDERTMRKALANLLPGDKTFPLYLSAQARSRADWLWGINGTRYYTIANRAMGGKGVRHVGRVMSPTLGLVVRRDLEIENFTARSYYELAAEVRTPSGSAVTLKHAPDAEHRIFDRDQAQALAQAASGAVGALRVTKEDKATAPPKLYSLARLQKAASKAWGWSAAKTLDVAQALYDKKPGLTTYPRAGTTYLPDEQVPDVPLILKALGTIPPLAAAVASITVNEPVIRPTVFSTAKLASEPHHAIIPTTEKADPASLTADERDLYLMIARQYLAALMPDYRYASTRIDVEAAGVPFTVTGNTPIAQGWRSVFAGADPDAEEGDQDEAEAGELPPIANGAPGKLGTVNILPKKTRPPARYTEGDLIADMSAIAKFATDPAVKARLRETSGIGTEATRASIINSLRERGYIEPQGKAIVSTAVGRHHHAAIDPRLTDPTMTALWEDVLTDIRNGKGGTALMEQFVDKAAGSIRALFDRNRERLTQAMTNQPPSEQQLAYAKKLADALGIALPEPAAKLASNCKAFIDAAAAKVSALPPSPKSIAFAEKLAGEAEIALPDECRTNRAACKAFIDQHAKPSKKATRKTTGAKRATKGRKS